MPYYENESINKSIYKNRKKIINLLQKIQSDEGSQLL